MGVSWVEQQPDAILRGEEVNDLNPCDSKSGTLGNTRMDVQYLWGNTCGEYTKDKMFASWALTSFDKPRTVVAGSNPGGLTSLVCP